MGNKLFGYARVSTVDQHLDRQLALLKEYGVEDADIFTDKMSGRKLYRPAFDELQRTLREGDTVLTESLSRLSRSTADLLAILSDWDKRSVIYISIKEQFDTSTPVGSLMLTVMAALSQFELDVTHSRVMEGLAAARARGHIGGRPRIDSKKIEKALRLYDSRSYNTKEIVEIVGISRGSLYNALKNRDKQRESGVDVSSKP